MRPEIIYSCPSWFRFGLRLFHSVSRLIPHLQIINLRCYTVVAGEPDVVTSDVTIRLWILELGTRDHIVVTAPFHVSAALFLHSLHSLRRAKPGGRRSRKERSERRVSRISLHSCRSSCRHSSSNPHGMNECSERSEVGWRRKGDGRRIRDERSEGMSEWHEDGRKTRRGEGWSEECRARFRVAKGPVPHPLSHRLSAGGSVPSRGGCDEVSTEPRSRRDG